jgi:hypothetical protein
VQISQAFKPDHDDVEYAQGKFMLRNLGLQVSTLVTLLAQSCCKSQSWKGTACVAATHQDQGYGRVPIGSMAYLHAHELWKLHWSLYKLGF